MYTKEQRNEYYRKWNAANPEKVKAAKKKYQQKNQEKINAERRAYRLANREKMRAAKLKWESENPEMVAMQKVRKRLREEAYKANHSLKYHYDITLNDYDTVLGSQNGVCAICCTARVTTKSKRLFVDHCHATGKLRALLCNHCNMGLGFFQDRTDLMLRAISYVKEFQEENDTNWALSVQSILPKLPALTQEKADGECAEDAAGASNHIRHGVGDLPAQGSQERRAEGLGES